MCVFASTHAVLKWFVTIVCVGVGYVGVWLCFCLCVYLCTVLVFSDCD